ncbi:F-box/LRR-repeat protein 6-like isoform X2 [Ostrea edulis]|uniref:F-box/LRR-repeat protein 6-like isoform X2 n=1 Tax=Ostrea edulis TaxID=37623 RepID=UPI0024AF1D63|nr:F-box/LRR-repeat protein 6-like isoform X2 [Ostrea edulis]
MKRCRKGILGVKKDPKNQILFSFSAREGEEWPSDDSDSDFVPSDEDDKPAAKVCQLWRNIASHPSLWRKVDLSFGWIRTKRDTLRWLVQERLTQCAEINLTNWAITNDQLKMVLQNCHELKSINLSHCKKISQDGFTALVDNCTNLQGVDVSFTSISVGTLKDITLKHGLLQLKELHLGGNYYLNFPALANSIFENCPQLEVLDASNCRFSGDYVSMDVQKFQTGCPKLRVLRMGSSQFRLKKTSGSLPGFEELRELSLGCIDLSKSCGISTAFVYDILVKSSKLKLLDLGGCWNMEDMTPLLGLPFTELEQLYLSNSPIRLNYLLGPLLQKCNHSLRILHIDKNIFKEDSLDSALQELFPQFGSSPLEMISAAETNISESSVEIILRHCGNLQYINLSSCRALPRGIKREYRNAEIKTLKSFCGIK